MRKRKGHQVNLHAESSLLKFLNLQILPSKCVKTAEYASFLPFSWPMRNIHMHKIHGTFVFFTLIQQCCNKHQGIKCQRVHVVHTFSHRFHVFLFSLRLTTLGNWPLQKNRQFLPHFYNLIHCYLILRIRYLCFV